MALEKSDFKEIKKIVETSAEATKVELRKEIQESESRVIKVISREINDLAAINRAVISEVDKVDQLEKRVNRLEVKAGIRG